LFSLWTIGAIAPLVIIGNWFATTYLSPRAGLLVITLTTGLATVYVYQALRVATGAHEKAAVAIALVCTLLFSAAIDEIYASASVWLDAHARRERSAFLGTDRRFPLQTSRSN
jgi:ACR3 family arsenite efflux pump ArsB